MKCQILFPGKNKKKIFQNVCSFFPQHAKCLIITKGKLVWHLVQHNSFNAIVWPFKYHYISRAAFRPLGRRKSLLWCNPVSILYKSTAGRSRPVRVADGPITARCRFIKNASWERPKWCSSMLWSVKSMKGTTRSHGHPLQPGFCVKLVTYSLFPIPDSNRE